MSTSERDQSAPPSIGATDAAALAGLPDVTLLARLANEFFSAMPGGTTPPGPAIAAAPTTKTLPSASPATPAVSYPAGAPIPAYVSGVTGPRAPYAGHGAVPHQIPSESDLRGGSALGGGLANRTSSVYNGAPSLGGVTTSPSVPSLGGAPSLGAPPSLGGAPSFGGVPAGTYSFLDQAALGGPSAPATAAPAAVPAPQPESTPAAGEATSLLGFQGFDFSPTVVPDLGSATAGSLDVGRARADFPILKERVEGRPLVWLDNAATTQKPKSVIDRISYFYEHENSNIHRAAHTLAARSTDAYEAAREKSRRFLNAGSVKEIVFARGTTEAINLVAQSWGRRYIEPGDEIVISWLEHHSNIVPWQLLCREKGARLKVAPVDDDGQIILSEYEKLFTSKTKFASISQVSNALGTITPVADMVDIAHRFGAKVLVDGAQAVSHMAVDVQALDCDFYVFSGHKVFGPTGIGVLRGKEEVLNSMPPWQGGGNMIADVTFEKTVYHPAPMRFEAGTGNIADAVGLGAALDYVQRFGMDNIGRYEHGLLEYGTERLLCIPGLRIIGTAKEKAGVMSFIIDGHRVEEIGQALAGEGIAVRAGHHCAQPALRRFGLESTVRPSLALYNDTSDIDALIDALKRIVAGRKYG